MKVLFNALYFPSLQLHVLVRASQTAVTVELMKAVEFALPATATPTAMNMATVYKTVQVRAIKTEGITDINAAVECETGFCSVGWRVS